MAQKKTKKRSRTYARNRSISRRGYEKLFESDGEYLLKLILCVLLGSFWIKFNQPFVVAGLSVNAIPVGLFGGLLLVSQIEKLQSDRKIWYATLLIVGIISYYVPAGIII